MANNRQPFALNQQLPILSDMAFDALARQGFFNNIGLLKGTSTEYQQDVMRVLVQKTSERLRPEFLQVLQAVVDDDRATVKAMLHAKPELLLISPPANLVIESKLTWQKFYAESALKMAAKRKQIEMIKIMMPYLNKMEQAYENEVAQAKADVLTAWQPQDKIVIPKEYADYAQSLIDVFKVETFQNGVPGENDIPFNVALNEKTELALSSLFNCLLPKKPVKLDDYLDPELFLLALYKVYNDNFGTFQNRDQRSAFCIRTIGLAQSVLSPETAKIFCQGLYHVVEENRKISDRAASLKLLDGRSFYRASRESISGLGFEYRAALAGILNNLRWVPPGDWFDSFETYVEQKTSSLQSLCSCSVAKTRRAGA